MSKSSTIHEHLGIYALHRIIQQVPETHPSCHHALVRAVDISLISGFWTDDADMKRSDWLQPFGFV